jgi:hypothetical protein
MEIARWVFGKVPDLVEEMWPWDLEKLLFAVFRLRGLMRWRGKMR